ncbi:PI-PLC X domain-containing protein At5g67130 [Linum grandiflorum]
MEAISAVAGVDRISQLPVEIIHIILQSLDSHKSAARTSILSRTWLHLWTTYPDVEFKDIGVNFESFASATSKRLRLAGPPLLLDTFTVKLGRWEDLVVGRGKEWLESYGETFIPSLYRLLSSGSSRSPIRVSIKNYLDNCNDFSPCLDMFLNCGRTKFLELTSCDISRSEFNINSGLENLEELRLDSVAVREYSFSSFLANAPRLEKLTLRWIRGIRHSLDISAAKFPSLKSLCVYHAHDEFKLELSSAPLLENFSFSGSLNFLNVVSAPNVKSVDLQPDYNLMHGEIEELISKFPSLESLGLSAGRLTSCNHTRKIRISAHTLRKLTLEYLCSGTEIEIDAPNLEILTIEASKLDIKCNVVNVVRVAPSCRFVFACSPFGMMTIGTSWLIELRKCVKAFAARFRHLVFKLELDLRYCTVETLDLTLVGMESSPVTVGHLLMGIDFKSATTEANFFDIALSAFHPKKLSIAESPCNRRLFSYVSEQIDRKNQRNCCSNDMCWRHQFKDAAEISHLKDECSSDKDCAEGLYCLSCPVDFKGSRCVRSNASDQFKLLHGVRALMLDPYDFKGGIWLCHSFKGKCHDFTAFEPLMDTLKEIEAFMSANPTEIVTLILEDHVRTPNDGNGGLKGNCTNRGESAALDDKSTSLVLVNHFGTLPVRGISCDYNSQGLMEMLGKCYTSAGNRWANFVAVDYYKRSDGGGAFEAVDKLNGEMLCGCGDVRAYVKGDDANAFSAGVKVNH